MSRYKICFAVFLVVLLTGCSGSDLHSQTATNNQTATQEITSESFQTDEPAATTKEIQETKSETETETETNSSKEISNTISDGQEAQMRTLILTVNGQDLKADFADNSSAKALADLLKDGSLEVNMRDYGGMEKVGGLGSSLPTNDEQITTEAGDLILFTGNQFVIYYAPNSWNFTRLGHIDNVSQEELKSILGTGSVTMTFELIE